MTKIYVSPTNQTGNKYAGIAANEAEIMHLVSVAEVAELQQFNCEVRLGDYRTRMWELSGGRLVGGRIKEAADWGADWYLENHSNATGVINTAVGASMYYRKGYSPERDAMAREMVSDLNRICPHRANRSGLYDGYEMGYGAVVYSENAGMKGFLNEINFHDNPLVAQWLVQNTGLIGRTMAQTVGRVLGLTRKTPGETYTVRSGDTLASIAQAVLGDAERYPEIAELNGIKSPWVIYPGQTLKLPGGQPTPVPEPMTIKLPAGTPIFKEPSTDLLKAEGVFTIVQKRGRFGQLKSPGRGWVLLPEDK